MKTIFLASALILATVCDASAVSLSLDECIGRALKENRSLKSVEMESAATAESVPAARAALLPSVRMRAFYTLVDRPGRLIIDKNTFGTNLPSDDVDITTNDQDFYSLGFSVDQPVFTGGRLTHSFRKAKAESTEAVLQEESEREKLVFKVKQGFYDALNAGLQREIAEKVAEAKKERLRVLTELNLEGYVSREDVMSQDADVAFAELEVTKGANREQLALSDLRRLMNYTGQDELQLRGMPSAVTMVVSLDEVKKHAVANARELKVAGVRIRGAEEDISIARSSYYPQVSVQGSYMRQRETNITRDDMWLFTANLDWPIFEWGKTAAEVRKKAALKQKLQYTHEESVLSTSLEAERAWRRVRELEQSVSAHEKRVRSVEYIAWQVTERHAEGTVKLTEVIEAEAHFLREFNAYMAVANDLNSAVASLELAGSGALPEWFEAKSLYIPAVVSCSSQLRTSVMAHGRSASKSGASFSTQSQDDFAPFASDVIEQGHDGMDEYDLEELLH